MDTDEIDDEIEILCLCRECMNTGSLPVHKVRIHLYVSGINRNYKNWIWHGEEVTANSRSCTSHDDFQYAHGDDEDEMELPEDAAAAIDMVQAAHEEFTGDPDSFQKLIEDAEKPLYPSCSSHTKVSTLIRLFNIKEKGGWSDKSFTELLREVKSMLPPNNELPESMYEVKKTLNALGMEYEKIHACPNDCLLFRKDYKDDNTCRTCGASRWKKAPSGTSKGVPEKVMWYFSPIPRFRRMFRSPKTSKHLIYHSLPRVEDGKLRHPVDSPTWKLVDNKWPEFAKEPRNLRLALSTDGFNPNSSVGGNYSCWPVMLAIYNFPLKLCMKRKFIVLTMLISGPKQPGNDIDVYLAPLIEDLHKLWDEGVEVYDAYKEDNFNLKAILLWTISDFPAYANLSGCPKGGYNACPICAERTSSVRLKYSGKNVYQSHRKFLPRKHKFRLDKKAFHGQQELGTAPKPYDGEEVLRQVEGIQNVWGKTTKSKPVYWKKKSILLEVPACPTLSRCHAHGEKHRREYCWDVTKRT